jgi:serine O-acetyltransferase
MTAPEAKIHLPPEAFDTPEKKRALAKAILKEHYERFPHFWEALEEDTKLFIKVRGEDRPLTSRAEVVREALRLSWETDAFFALALYRARGRLLARGVPVLPTVIHKVCMALSQLDIGEPAYLAPGVYIPHGQVVIDGPVEVGKGSVIAPWSTLGLVAGSIEAPKIGKWVFVGTGARILGARTIGDRAQIGANAVVTKDVPPDGVVGGVPARPLQNSKAMKGMQAMRQAMVAKHKAEQAKAAEAVAETDHKDGPEKRE